MAMADEPASAPAAAAWPADGAVDSRASFQAAVRGVIHGALQHGVRRMCWVSPDFDGWPLNEPEALEALSAWMRGRSVQLVWLADDFEPLRHRAPRLVTWRQTWSHRVLCLTPQDPAGHELPTLLLADDQVLVQAIDTRFWRGRVSSQALDLVHAREQIDAISQRCAETFPVTTLGI